MTEWYESDKGRALYGIESKSPAAAELRALGYRVEESEGPAPVGLSGSIGWYVVRCLWVLQPGEFSRPLDFVPFFGPSHVNDVWADRTLRAVLRWHNEPPCWRVT